VVDNLAKLTLLLIVVLAVFYYCRADD